MGKARVFTTLPVAMIADTELSALDIRCAAVIALHDGMSAVSGKGGGCFARNSTLAALARTDPTNFSKSLTKLMRKGYVAREPQLMDKRRFTLRVQYPADESWRDGQPSIDRIDVHTGEIVGEATNPDPEIVGDGNGENGGFSREIGRDYISLNEELHFDESKELNSTEVAHVDAHFPPSDGFSASDFGIDLSPGKEKDTAEAGLGRVTALAQHLPRNFGSLPLGAQVSRLDQAYTKAGRDPNDLDSRERASFIEWLDSIVDEYLGGELDTIAQQAGRLRDDLHVW